MAGGTRYVRYIVIAFVALVVIFFISSSSSSSVPGTEYLQNAKDQFTSHPIWNSGASGPRPGDAVPSPHALVDEDAKNPIFPANPVSSPTPGSSLSSGLQDPDNFLHPEKQLSTPNPYTGSSGSQTSLPYTAPGTRMNATFVTLARNSDIWEISHSIRQIEDRFNRFYNYDWVFLNDGDFDEPFKKITTALTSGRARYGKIDSEHWGFPDFISQEKAEKVREEMKQKKIIYGDSVSYRHMCRYESGFFFRHPLMLEYEWYWRVEPSVNVYCDISYDPFKFMAENKKKYSFVISLYEYVETIPTLWESVKKFMKAHPEHIVEGNSMEWISDDGGNSYNHCHFWSNFEIASLEWLRSKAYVDYFDFLDHEGGFFYERWGDAPVHSIAAALMLKKEEIHFFNDIAYYHVPFTHCPTGEQTRLDLKCHCDPKENFDWNGYSCLTRYYDVNKMEKPAGYAAEQ